MRLTKKEIWICLRNCLAPTEPRTPIHCRRMSIYVWTMATWNNQRPSAGGFCFGATHVLKKGPCPDSDTDSCRTRGPGGTGVRSILIVFCLLSTIATCDATPETTHGVNNNNNLAFTAAQYTNFTRQREVMVQTTDPQHRTDVNQLILRHGFMRGSSAHDANAFFNRHRRETVHYVLVPDWAPGQRSVHRSLVAVLGDPDDLRH